MWELFDLKSHKKYQYCVFYDRIRMCAGKISSINDRCEYKTSNRAPALYFTLDPRPLIWKMSNNMTNFYSMEAFLWAVVDLLRGDFKQSQAHHV